MAALVARRSPDAAVALLLIPTGYLATTWAPDAITGSHPMSSGIALVVAFTIPAIAASALIWQGRARTNGPKLATGELASARPLAASPDIPEG
jgi:hypothetical protein